MDAKTQLHSDPEMDSAALVNISDCQRSLKFDAVRTWQVFGEPGAHGWCWYSSAFEQAKLRVPAFLGGNSQPDNSENYIKSSYRAGCAGEKRHRVDDGAEGAEDLGEDS